MIRRASLISLPVVLVLALAACAATPTPESTQAAAPTPTPSATAAALPLPALPLTCADVLSDAEASEIVQYPISLKFDENDFRTERDIAGRQSGLLHCIWGGTDKTDNGWDQSIVIDILPDAVADYDVGVMQVDDGAIVYTVGDLSEYLCPSMGELYSWCNANLLIDGYWAHVSANAQGSDNGRTVQTAEAGMASVLDTLAARIPAAAPANPAWSAPDGVVSGAFCADVTASSAVIQAAFPGETMDAREIGDSYVDVETIAQDRAALTACYWTGASVSVVPGGAWAFPALLASPPTVSWSMPPLVAAQVPGADAALVSCTDEGWCAGLVSAGGSAISVDGPNMGDGPFAAALASVVAAVVAAG